MGRRERFLDPDLGPVERFASELRALRESAGGPSYRELARRAYYSVATLSQAASGHALPSLAVTLAYVRSCGGDEQAWRARWHAVSAESAPDENDLANSPYLGLATFQPDDADRFFGRSELVDELCRRINGSSFLAVFGPSGSGKSSLLRAGLLAALEPEHCSAVLVTPGTRPLTELRARLGLPPEAPTDGLITQVLATQPAGARLVIVIDQFEEIFTLCTNETERAHFVDLVIDAAEHGDRVRVVLGVRADFLDRCARYPKLVTALRDRQVLVGPMAVEDLRAAIREPAVRAGLNVETALVERTLADAGTEPGALPLVSHALLETWKRRAGKTMTLAGYLRAGGVRSAIAHTADRVYEELDAQAQDAARDVFLRLTAVGEGTEHTRRRVPREELTGEAEVLPRLAAARLVTVDTETVEVAHEALIRSWPRLRTWLADDRDLMLAHRQLTEAVGDWTRHDRDEGLLYRGARLAAWQDRPLDRLNDAERAFLSVSHRAEEKAHRVRRRHVRLAFGGLGSATVLVTVLAVIAMLLAARAEDDRAAAVSQQLVSDARAQLPLDAELALLLAREAYTANPNAETEAILRQAVADSHIRATLPIPQDGVLPPDAVTGVAFSRDGRQLVTTGAFGPLQVWSWGDGHVARTAPRAHRIPDGAKRTVFSPDGRHLAAASPNGVVLMWNWADVRWPETLLGCKDGALAVAFDPGARLAAACENGTVQIWDPRGFPQEALRGHVGPVRAVSFAADGRSLASAGNDGTVRVWDLVAGGDPVVLRGHQGWVKAVEFSPDGQHLVSGGLDGTVRLWDKTSSQVLGNHDGGVESVAYSADGRSILSTGDNTVRIWSPDRPAMPVVLRGHHATVMVAAFSRDGGTVVSGGGDGTAKVWQVDEVETETMLGSDDGLVWSIAASPLGDQVAIAGLDGTVQLWNVAGDRPPVVLPGPRRLVSQVTFSLTATTSQPSVWTAPSSSGT